MRITIAAVGRLRSGAVASIVEDYRKRLTATVLWREVEERRPLSGEALKRREAELLLAALPGAGVPLIALDGAGTARDSVGFAEALAGWTEEGGGHVAFVIGGADGLHPDLLTRARDRLSLGPMTWPHMLVRAMLMEQLYRAQTIRSGHPYHRA